MYNKNYIENFRSLFHVIWLIIGKGVTSMANEKILLVDDDRDMQAVLRLYLEKDGFTVFTATDSFSALSIVEDEVPELIILDVMMPNLDGFELCQYMRRVTDVPILFFSSKVDDADKVLGLGVGGDDYIEKSTSLPVVVARVKAHLRRNRSFPHEKNRTDKLPRTDQSVLEFPGLIIKLDSAVVKVNNEIVKLSAKEYQILCLMAQNPDRIYSVEQLFEQVWGEDSLGDYRTVMVHISNLRKKIEQNSEDAVYIHTFRGIGYKFNDFRKL